MAVSKTLLQAARKMIDERGECKIITYTQYFEQSTDDFCGNKQKQLDDTGGLLVTFKFMVKS